MSETAVMLAGRYRLDARLAAGGMGEVWRAADLVLSRPVAVKLLRAEYASHPQTLARFRAEARHASSVTHPGIAQVYDYGESGPPHSPYLVMELVEGPSLAGLLAAGPLDCQRTMDVIAQAAAGLAAAHAAGLVHRDIKPANLLLGPGGAVKITDFGIAYAAGSAPLTQTGTLIGTPAYFAPERAEGHTATAASDLYSLGVVAYECLAGSPPFTGDPLEVAAAHRLRPLPPLPAAIAGEVATLVAELTSKDPAARPASAGEVAARAARLSAADGTAGPAQDGGTRVIAGPSTLPGLPLPQPPAPRRPGPRVAGLPRPGRGVLVALVLTAVLAGLAGWLLAGLASPAPRAAPPPAAPTGATHPAIRTVRVDAAALTGLPVRVARQRLLQLGLVPRVIWVPRHQRPGMVVAVHPTGRLRRGTMVTLVGAYRPHRHGKGHGGGGDQNGNGRGHGGGGN